MALNWGIYGPERSKKDVKSECTVRLNNDGKGSAKSVLVFRFYNGSYNKFNKGSDYVIFTTNDDKTRVYFKNAKNGFKLSQSPNYKSIRYRFDKAQYTEWQKWIGDYNIVFDSNEQHYYIDINGKI